MRNTQDGVNGPLLVWQVFFQPEQIDGMQSRDVRTAGAAMAALLIFSPVMLISIGVALGTLELAETRSNWWVLAPFAFMAIAGIIANIDADYILPEIGRGFPDTSPLLATNALTVISLMFTLPELAENLPDKTVFVLASASAIIISVGMGIGLAVGGLSGAMSGAGMLMLTLTGLGITMASAAYDAFERMGAKLTAAGFALVIAVGVAGFVLYKTATMLESNRLNKHASPLGRLVFPVFLVAYGVLVWQVFV